MNLPDKVSERGLEPELRRKLNQLIDYLREMQLRSSASVSVQRTAEGVSLSVNPSSRGSGNGGVPRWG
jgi:hypothetical protein